MLRHSVLIIAACVAASSWFVSHSQEPTDVPTLQKDRISLLQQRVTVLKEYQKAGRVGGGDLIRPEMDLINAQIEYTKDTDDLKGLYQQLLAQYDKLIESARLNVESPRGPDVKSTSFAQAKLLFVKSERIRIQILLASIDEK